MQQPGHFPRENKQTFSGFNYVRAYIDDLLIITKGSFEDHLKHLDNILEKLETEGFKINATKSCFVAHELEYLGYWISRDGIQPLATKVEAIIKISKPKNRQALRSFIGMINYYRDMWKHQSALLVPLTALTSDKIS